MEINASSTCKYLKRKVYKRADLHEVCRDLRMIATDAHEAAFLTALYRLQMDGGTIKIEPQGFSATVKPFRYAPAAKPRTEEGK